MSGDLLKFTRTSLDYDDISRYIYPEEFEHLKAEPSIHSVKDLAELAFGRGASEHQTVEVFLDPQGYLGTTIFELAGTDNREIAARWLERRVLRPARKALGLPNSTVDELLEYVNFSEIVAPRKALTRIENLLGLLGIFIIFGPSGAGKTFFELWLAFCLATGRPFFGRKVEKCAVVLVLAEEPHSGLRRLNAIKISEKVHDDIPLSVITAPIQLFKDSKSEKALIETCKKIFADFGANDGVVLIDTLAAVAGDAEENSAKDMGQIISTCRRIGDATNAAVGLVHHTGKDLNKGSRGSNAPHAAANTVLEIKDMTAKVLKQRDGALGATMSFGLKFIHVGEFGETEMVPVLFEKESDVVEVKKLTRVTSEVFEVLKSLAKDATKPVTKAAWREALKYAFSDAPSTTVSSRFTRALEELSALRKIEVRGSQVTILNDESE